MIRFSLLMLSACTVCTLLADEPKKPAIPNFSNRLTESVTAGQTSKPDEIMEHIWCGDVTDPKTQNVCWQAYQARMNYYMQGLIHRQEDFGSQHSSSRVIFVMVLCLVTAGMYFAWVQFRHDLTSPPQKEGSEGKTGSTASEVAVGTDGIKVTSPVLGVVILALSLAFFYLYLHFVYPISDTF